MMMTMMFVAVCHGKDSKWYCDGKQLVILGPKLNMYLKKVPRIVNRNNNRIILVCLVVVEIIIPVLIAVLYYLCCFSV